jgi:hypothetical protein
MKEMKQHDAGSCPECGKICKCEAPRKYLKAAPPSTDKFGAGVMQMPQDNYKEHTKIVSRTTGKKVEVSFGPLGGGLVPANPFASMLQQKFAYANPSKFGGNAGLKEWSDATDQKHLPKKVKK